MVLWCCERKRREKREKGGRKQRIYAPRGVEASDPARWGEEGDYSCLSERLAIGWWKRVGIVVMSATKREGTR